MIYKMTLKDSADEMTFDLLEVPIVDKDIEGAVDNVTLDGNQYTDYLWLKKQFIQKWSILCDDEYTRLRGFYTRQFENADVPSYRLYYGDDIIRNSTLGGERIELSISGVADGTMSLTQMDGNIEQTTYTGKNLFNATGGTASASGVTFTRNADGTYTANGKATAFIGYTIGTITFPTATSVTYNGCPSGGAGSTYSINLQKVNGGVWLTDETGSGQTATLEANEEYSVRLIIRSGVTVNNIVYKPMVRLSSISDATYEPYVGGTASPNPDYPQAVNTATGENVVEISDGQGNEQSYEVNLGALELCKIGTHQDRIYKNDGKWYIEKQTGKAAIDTSAITQIGNYSNIEYATTAKPSDFAGYGNYQNIGVLCSHATYQDGGDSAFWNQSSNAGHMYTRADNRVFWVGFAKGTGLNAMKTALANCIIYYPLATPTTTEITNEALVAELEALQDEAISVGLHNIYTDTPNALPTLTFDLTEYLSKSTTIIPETAVRLTLTDGGVINACGCRKDVQLTMRETIE